MIHPIMTTILNPNQTDFSANAEPDVSEFIANFLTCSITRKIYHTPVIDKSGKICEFSVCSPNEEVYTVTGLKSLTNCLLDKYPEFKINQFNPDKDYKKCHSSNKQIIKDLIGNKKFTELKKYTSFSIKYLPAMYVSHLIKNADPETLKYFIDNSIDLSTKTDDKNYYLVNYICEDKSNSNPDIVRYILDKGNQMKLCLDMEACPLHQILHNSINPELDIHAINKYLEDGLDLYKINQNGISHIISIFQKQKIVIKHLISKLDINSNNFKTLIPELLNEMDNNKYINDNDKDEILQMFFA